MFDAYVRVGRAVPSSGSHSLKALTLLDEQATVKSRSRCPISARFAIQQFCQRPEARPDGDELRERGNFQ